MCIDIKRHPIAFEMQQKINIEENALKHSGKDKANCEKSLKCFSGRKNSFQYPRESWKMGIGEKKCLSYPRENLKMGTGKKKMLSYPKESLGMDKVYIMV